MLEHPVTPPQRHTDVYVEMNNYVDQTQTASKFYFPDLKERK